MAKGHCLLKQRQINEKLPSLGAASLAVTSVTAQLSPLRVAQTVSHGRAILEGSCNQRSLVEKSRAARRSSIPTARRSLSGLMF